MTVTRQGWQRMVGVAAIAWAVGALILPQPASAAGAERLTITGPRGNSVDVDLYKPIPPALAMIREDLRAWFLMDIGVEDVPASLATAPTTELGPRYSATWTLLGPRGGSIEDRQVHQSLYPLARGGPLIYTPPRARLWSGAVGWFRSDDHLLRTLESMGLSPRGEPRSRVPVPVVIAAVGAALAALVVGIRLRRKRDRLAV